MGEAITRRAICKRACRNLSALDYEARVIQRENKDRLQVTGNSGLNNSRILRLHIYFIGDNIYGHLSHNQWPIADRVQ